MTWFFLALLIALGGIWAAYKRAKRMPPLRDPKDHGPTDDASLGGERIDINDPASLARWSADLGVDEYDLRGAIQEAGSNAETVRRHLAER